ncbi:DUF6452 family protein [Croceitalea sp. P059]|uniref:DUF6452 family protein n=1 Tax=Croceitalea sp. P059 TaxID=3075601 RepID=UPI0028871AED|nr:DUF6452 family protein [Croceitalea sp. P059]MDT0540226.1 DUF6452 family protein [Croceitalea sp. P059]
MKKILSALSIITVILYFSSCEKDDICVEGDTPFLVIGFYDADDEDTTVFKTVSSLRIRGIDNDSIYSSDTFSDRSSVSDSILIPLRLDNTTTQFEFISNSATDDATELETGIIDTLSFNYEVGEEYVSRACGFVGNFNELDTTRQVFSSDWIKRITILESDIDLEKSNTIHVKIFH